MKHFRTYFRFEEGWSEDEYMTFGYILVDNMFQEIIELNKWIIDFEAYTN